MIRTPANHAVPNPFGCAARIRVLVFVCLSAVACAPAGAEEKPQWRRALEAANELSSECFGGSNDADCEAMIRHYDAALAAPDASDAIRHDLFAYRLNAVAVHGGHLVDAGDTKRALSVLYAGYTEMREHFEGGKHAHTVIENLRLQGHLLRALVAADDLENAATVVDLPRQVMPYYYGTLDEYRDNENEKELALIAEGVVRSEELETRYGDALIARANALGADPRAKVARADAIVAYRNALQWLQRGNAEGWAMPFADTNAIRFAKLNNTLGDALLASGDRKGAIDAHNLAFAAARCKGLDDGTLRAADRAAAARPCRQAVAGYMAASGETQRLASDAAETMYRQQMELYNTDIGQLLRVAPKQAD